MPSNLPQSLEASGIRFVRVLWCDNVNVIRAKAIHTGALAHHLEHGVGISTAQMAVPVMYDAVVPEAGLGPVGEVRLVPDWATLTPLPYSPGHARVLGDMMKDGAPWPVCPRGFLKRMVAEARRLGLEVMAAFENEFYLLRGDGDGIAPADDTVFASTQAMDANRAVIDAIADALLAQGIPVEQYHAESGPGQHELSVRHTHPLQAADRQIAFRETVHAVAAAHGLRASFLPKIFEDRAGSGCHLHLSLWRGDSNVTPVLGGRLNLSDLACAFIGGLLEHLPALMAVTTPSPNSYRRIRPHCWSGAFRCWGPDNREAAVRVPTNPAGPGPSQFELKTADAAANPYLALGAVLAAGLDGIRRRLDPGEPVDVDPGHLSEAERERRGLLPLPANLDGALDLLERDEALRSALGPELARAFLAVRRAEGEALRGLELAEEVQLLRERY